MNPVSQHAISQAISYPSRPRRFFAFAILLVAECLVPALLIVSALSLYLLSPPEVRQSGWFVSLFLGLGVVLKDAIARWLEKRDAIIAVLNGGND